MFDHMVVVVAVGIFENDTVGEFATEWRVR